MQQVVGCTLAYGVWDWSRVPATPGVISTDGALGRALLPHGRRLTCLQGGKMGGHLKRSQMGQKKEGRSNAGHSVDKP